MDNIRYIREGKHISQKQLAAAIGTSQSAIAAYENGQKTPKLETLSRIADALELPYTPKSVFVELYIDNEYQGLYQMSEKTQIGTNRIEITDLEELNEKENEGIDLDSLGVRMTKSNNKFNSISIFTFNIVNKLCFCSRK